MDEQTESTCVKVVPQLKSERSENRAREPTPIKIQMKTSPFKQTIEKRSILQYVQAPHNKQQPPFPEYRE